MARVSAEDLRKIIRVLFEAAGFAAEEGASTRHPRHRAAVNSEMVGRLSDEGAPPAWTPAERSSIARQR